MMKQITARAESVLNAPAKDVYAAIADYHNGHPYIVPPEYFSDLIVEEGGYGEGTIIRFAVKVLGVTQHFHHRVSEPEPGRVLVEQDMDEADEPRDLRTMFTVDPVEGGKKARVEIRTTMNASPGIAGLLESIMIPRVNASIYRKELKLLEVFAQKTSATAGI